MDILTGARGVNDPVEIMAAVPNRLHLNSGTEEYYQFEGWEPISLNGSDEGLLPYSKVHVVDLNRDGKKDLLITGRHQPITADDNIFNLHYFENKGSDAAPVFDE